MRIPQSDLIYFLISEIFGNFDCLFGRMSILDSLLNLHAIVKLDELFVLLKLIAVHVVALKPFEMRPPSFDHLQVFLQIYFFLNVAQVFKIILINDFQIL